jgi:hypothetical protein
VIWRIEGAECIPALHSCYDIDNSGDNTISQLEPGDNQIWPCLTSATFKLLIHTLYTMWHICWLLVGNDTVADHGNAKTKCFRVMPHTKAATASVGCVPVPLWGTGTIMISVCTYVRKEREPNFPIPFLSSALGERWRISVADCLHLIASSSRKAKHRI